MSTLRHTLNRNVGLKSNCLCYRQRIVRKCAPHLRNSGRVPQSDETTGQGHLYRDQRRVRLWENGGLENYHEVHCCCH